MNHKSADGIIGQLIRAYDGRYVFRVYNKDVQNTFTDYDLHHSDLTIKIMDVDASFYTYNDDSNGSLDHSPETLGLT